MRLALIPARGGSKRIPSKNIRLFYGKPILAYSIKAAMDSGCFDKIIVSTDDKETADIAREFGADVPFMRPVKISHDHATTADVIKHVIEWYQDTGIDIELICNIYATAPFIEPADIRKGLELMQTDPTASYAITVTSFPFPIQRAMAIRNGVVEMFQPEHLLSRSQDLEEAYMDAGQFSWGRPQAYLDDIPAFSAAARPIIIPRKRVQDIDTMEDWEYAEALYGVLNNQ